MTIPVNCSQCNSRFSAPDQAHGKTAKCPKCGNRLTVGQSRPSSDPANGKLEVSCSDCNAHYRVDSSLSGKVCKCQKCGASITIPQLHSAESKSGTAKSTATEPPSEKKCPGCGSTLRVVLRGGKPTGDDVCMECDYVPGLCPLCNGKLRTEQSEQCLHCNSSWRAPAIAKKTVVSREVAIPNPKVVQTEAGNSPALNMVIGWVVLLVVMIVAGALGGLTTEFRLGDNIRAFSAVRIGQGLMTCCIGVIGAFSGFCMPWVASKLNIFIRFVLAVLGLIVGYLLGLLVGSIFVGMISGTIGLFSRGHNTPEFGTEIGQSVLNGNMSLVEAGILAAAVLYAGMLLLAFAGFVLKQKQKNWSS